MNFQAAGRTHKGMVRSGNEDNLLVASDRGVFVVADGMGGHDAGEVASAIVIAAFKDGTVPVNEETYPWLYMPNHSPEQNFLMACIQAASQTIADQNEAAYTNMGTTVVAMHVRDDNMVTIGHLGDSRIYRLQRGRLEQLTKDHSAVQELRDSGYTAEIPPYLMPIITKAVGLKVFEETPTDIHRARPGDVFLLCSDGLSNELSDEEITQILSWDETPDHLADSLIQKANLNGGHDNVTVIVVKFL